MIDIVTALIRDERGHVLLVRKRGTVALMQPGGKREPGESDLQSLERELHEELGCRIAAESAQALGVFEAPAANEPGQRVRASVYGVRISGPFGPRAEIAEHAWIDPHEPGDRVLAPLTRDVVLPLARSLNEAAQAR
ncbi:NUDIX hydrolase [Microvirga subterranea]|uniref:8-oxo-dGTP diphosphatase n=1 Tax=Microvirga subterranea TaxID=186651 RepID=A0A370HTX1_9HYPH|nr:NUDIX domain-containing protein [Microvirga subterranea]RDI61966.1 8-oxo-dGTP diphosphatase [Microvirga subterranea]